MLELQFIPIVKTAISHKDFIHVQAKDGLQEFLLNVPRRKQRGISWREQFKPFALSAEIGMEI